MTCRLGKIIEIKTVCSESSPIPLVGYGLQHKVSLESLASQDHACSGTSNNYKEIEKLDYLLERISR